MKPVRFLQLTDTHIGAEKTSTHRGYCGYERTLCLLEGIKKHLEGIDFIVHTGDVCGDKEVHATQAAYELAAPLFRSLPVPFYFLPGNHDETGFLKDVIELPTHDILVESDEYLSYRFTFDGVHFVALDARVAKKRAGVLPEDQLEALKSFFHSSEGPVVLFLHYPPVPIQAAWMDENMLVTNGNELHKLLCCFRERVSGVFFGHVHQPLQIVHDGILYVSAASSIFQFATRHNDDECRVDTQAFCGFNEVVVEESFIRVNPRPLLLPERD